MSCSESHKLLNCASQICAAYPRAAPRHGASSLASQLLCAAQDRFSYCSDTPVGQRRLIRRLRLTTFSRAILAIRDWSAYAVLKLTIGCEWAVTDYSECPTSVPLRLFVKDRSLSRPLPRSQLGLRGVNTSFPTFDDPRQTPRTATYHAKGAGCHWLCCLSSNILLSRELSSPAPARRR